MFKWIKKIKEHDSLTRRVKELESEVTAILSKAPIDLTRECLKILPLDKNFNPNDPEFGSTTHLQNMENLSDNGVLNSEIKKIIFEQVKYIAEQSPSRESDLLARGTINGVTILQERLLEAKEFLAYQKRQARGLAEE